MKRYPRSLGQQRTRRESAATRYGISSIRLVGLLFLAQTYLVSGQQLPDASSQTGNEILPLMTTGAEVNIEGRSLRISGLTGDQVSVGDSASVFLPLQGEVELPITGVDPFTGETLVELPLEAGDTPGVLLVEASMGAHLTDEDAFDNAITPVVPQAAPSVISFLDSTTVKRWADVFRRGRANIPTWLAGLNRALRSWIKDRFDAGDEGVLEQRAP